MKISTILKGGAIAALLAVVVAGPVFAVDFAGCTGSDAAKYPNIATKRDDTYKVKCSAVDSGDGNHTYVTFYAKTSADCAQAASLASDPDSCTGDDLNTIIRNIINAIIFAIGMVAVVMIIIGGVNYATSQGDPGKVKKGKDTIMYGIIGLVVAVLAFAIVNFVIGALGSQ